MRKLFLLCLFLPQFCLADDLGVGVEVEAEAKLTKELGIAVEGEFRTQEAVSDMERWSLGASLDYRLLKTKQWSLKADAGYLFLDRHILAEDTKKYHYVDYWSARHRAFASLSGSWKINKHLELSLRERYQLTHRTPQNLERYYQADLSHRASDKVKDAGNEQLLRSRLQLKWNIGKKNPFTPFVSVECLNDLDRSFAIDQTRYIVGTDYKLDKHNSFGISYRYKDKSNEDEDKGHLFTISYSHAF